MALLVTGISAVLLLIGSLLLEAEVLAPQPAQLVTLIRGRAVVALAAVALVLATPVGKRLLRHAKALSQLARGAARAQQLHRLATELQRMRRSNSGHGHQETNLPSVGTRFTNGFRLRRL